ncbi:MAG: flagellin [Aquifex sp.]|nr:MAG: flagellin [Aquifex sp.]
MATRINYNYEAAVTYTSLKQNERLMNKSLLRLSTGLRILSAADDASGLFIADQLSLVSTALDQGNRNIQFAISALQIAEGSVSQIYDKLKTMYQKAVSAANDVNDSNARDALQRDIENLRDAILKIAQDTEYNGLRLLNGSFNNVRVHYGARAAQTLSVSIASVLPQQLGGYVAESSPATLQDSTLALLGTGGLLAGNQGYTVDNGDYLKFTFNDGTTVTLNSLNQLGYLIDPANNTYILDASAVANTINNNATLQNKGVRAYAENVSVADRDFNLTVGDSATIKFYAGGELVFEKTYNAGTVSLDEFIADINDQAQGKLVASKDSSGNRLVLKTPNGETISVEVTAGTGTTISLDMLVYVDGNSATSNNVSGGTGSAVKVGTLTVMGVDKFDIEALGIEFFNIDGDSTTVDIVSANFNSLETIDVTTSKGAQIAQVLIQSAIRQVDTIRSQIGSTIINLQAIYDAQAIAKDNVDNAESVIRNVDFAKEMTEFTKYQIRMQSGVAMLAQANTLPQLVLQLLR